MEHQIRRSNRVPGQSELLRSAFYSSTGKVTWDLIGRSLSFLLSVYIARKLGAAGYGSYAVIWYLAWMTAQVTDLGLHLVTIRQMSHREHGRAPGAVLGGAIVAKAVLTAVTFMGYAGVAYITTSSPKELGIALVFYAAALGGSWTEFFGVALRSQNRIALEGAVLALLRAGWLAGVMLCLQRGGGVEEIAWALAATGLPSLVLSTVLAQRLVRPRWDWDSTGTWLELLKQSAPLAITSLLTLAYLRLDVLFLAQLQGSEAAGLFTASLRIYEGLFLFSGGIVAGAFPWLVAGASSPGIQKLSELVLRMLLWIALPAAVGLAALAEPIIVLFFGPGYGGSVLPLKLLAVAVMAVYINALTTHILVATRRGGKLVACILVRFAVGLTIDLALIPHWGPAGAAVAVAGAEWSLTVATLMSARRSLMPRTVLRAAGLPVAGALVMAAVLQLLPDPLLLRVALGATVYGMAFLVLWKVSRLVPGMGLHDTN